MYSMLGMTVLRAHVVYVRYDSDKSACTIS